MKRLGPARLQSWLKAIARESIEEGWQPSVPAFSRKKLAPHVSLLVQALFSSFFNFFVRVLRAIFPSSSKSKKKKTAQKSRPLSPKRFESKPSGPATPLVTRKKKLGSR